jgi:hypothetical protein
LREGRCRRERGSSCTEQLQAFGYAAEPIDGQPDGVRPLAVGEVLHRLVARAVGLQLRYRFQQHFAPLQFEVATSGCCEVIVAGIRAYIEQEPQSLVLQVDLANAFNEVDRVAMFEKLRDHFPELVPFVRCFYAKPSRLSLRRDSGEWELLQSSIESLQGDPIAGHLFALPHRRGAASPPRQLFPIFSSRPLTTIHTV